MMTDSRVVHLFRNGRNQALRIPRDMELAATQVYVWRDGNRLVVEPLPATGLLATLKGLEPIEDDFPDVDEGLLPLDEESL